MRLWQLVRFDLRYLWRHRAYAVYIPVCAAYIALLAALPEDWRQRVLVLLTLSDPAAIGLLLAGAITLLERHQGVWDGLFATPVRLAEYVLARCLALGCLSVAAAWTIHLPSAGWPASPLQFTLGTALSSVFFSLLGLAAAARCRTINGLLLLVQLYALPFTLPLLAYVGWLESPLLQLLPTAGALLLLDGAQERVEWAHAAGAIGLLAIWIGAASWHVLWLLRRTVRVYDGGAAHE
ncbi:ABC transporter permease [Paenibacillus sp. IB182496]|uniref:ABC transporter permease n=1 Tax=Paenibacillus sabuli TaxID=2772509 RepID=A0A927GR90_9BACL|nr:ABC transporter permease [Paenibacillus sabuli]MBD2845369.1 ABC transporter permease [Paenibacillus sabuli]